MWNIDDYIQALNYSIGCYYTNVRILFSLKKKIKIKKFKLFISKNHQNSLSVNIRHQTFQSWNT